MSDIAVVSVDGVGLVNEAASSLPVTWVEVANVPSGARTKEKPVSAVAAVGLSPISPASNENEYSFAR